MLYSSFLLLFATVLKLGFSSTATFSSSNSGIDGWATVNDRWLTISLDFSKLDMSTLPGGASCLEGGLKYHLHTEWTYSDKKDRIGSTACGASYTGRHYDPYRACGPSSGNEYCETYNTDECVTSSSAYDENNVYACNMTTYEMNPYACEVGDWSGKYGTLQLTSNNMTNLTAWSFWEVESWDVQGMSIVFHCASDDTRAFCAPFDNSTDTAENEIWQTSDEQVLFTFVYPFAYFAFLSNGSYFGFVYAGIFDGICDSVIYRIYEDWESETFYCLGNDCIGIFEEVWDPTVSCMYGSDSEFCEYSGYHLCNDSSYTYMCDYTNDRYSCAPGDLSGKYGVINVTNNTYYIVAGDDELFPPFELIEEMSIVFECADHSVVFGGGILLDVNDTVEYNYTYNFTWTDFNFTMWNFSYFDNYTWWYPNVSNTSSYQTTANSTTFQTTPPGSIGSTASLNFAIYGLIGLVCWWRL